MADIKLICFDLDGTILNNNSWYELNLAFGMPIEEDQRLLGEYRLGRFSYEDWLQKILVFFQKSGKADFRTITDILYQLSTDYKEGVEEIINYLKSKNYRIALISGSNDILVNLVAKNLGIKFTRASNVFVFDENKNLEDIITQGDDSQAKVKFLEDFCRKLDLMTDECACIGDSQNDIGLFRKTGHGITFFGAEIEKEAWKVINKLSDLKEIL